MIFSPGYQVIHWCSCYTTRFTKGCESRWTASVRWIQITMFVTSDIVIISHACNLRSAIILTRSLRWDNLSIATIDTFSWHMYAISLVRNQRISLNKIETIFTPYFHSSCTFYLTFYKILTLLKVLLCFFGSFVTGSGVVDSAVVSLENLDKVLHLSCH